MAYERLTSSRLTSREGHNQVHSDAEVQRNRYQRWVWVTWHSKTSYASLDMPR